MNNPNQLDPFFAEPVDPRTEALTQASEAMSRLLIWMADAPTLESRGMRATVALYCVRPDLIGGATLEEIGAHAGITRQAVHKLALPRKPGTKVMNSPAPFRVVVEINRLYDEAQRLTSESRTSLHAALAAAWSAGRLLLEEKQRVRRLMGGGAWLLWLQQNFRGTPRTAQNYMRLARKIPELGCLHGLSLRQMYFRLGIATEPKTPAGDTAAAALPSHIRLANRLLVELKTRSRRRNGAAAEQADAYRRDLRALFEHLQRLFAAAQAENEVNFSPRPRFQSSRP